MFKTDNLLVPHLDRSRYVQGVPAQNEITVCWSVDNAQALFYYKGFRVDTD
jgi:hypothetical protein